METNQERIRNLTKRIEDLKLEIRMKEEEQKKRKAQIEELKERLCELGWQGDIKDLPEEIEKRVKELERVVSDVESKIKSS